MKYKYSIIMSIYNEKILWIMESIESILAQSFKDFEIIIIIDNPNYFEAIEFVKKLQLENLKYFVNEKNIGLALSLNKALEYSEGEYIVRMDSDDIMLENRLKIQDEEFKKNKKLDFLGTSAYMIDEEGNIFSDFKVPLKYKKILKKIKKQNCFIHPSIIIKKKILIEAGGYRNFPCSQDYDLFYRLLDKGYYGYNLSQKLLKYRIRTSSLGISKGLVQYLSFKYIKDLGKERRKIGKDSYSPKRIDEILKISEDEQKKFMQFRLKVLRSKNIKKILVYLKASFCSKYAFLFTKDLILSKLKIF
ncbi:glycosyltransferase [Candidatus Cetobacterium colombiensis]|uniref:Glycosyltransferase n=1 Tax=Candidatus Cetobacterium colombiensis TaxID=3073100 RepID=A0ABU4W9Q3_9FUSO|nr:glycosyltransferase [Candidatus Cetobacterium colombiensis]MDX8335944.1 glycosyltransferase [Candidatus Cetobacterium colombiensis]